MQSNCKLQVYYMSTKTKFNAIYCNHMFYSHSPNFIHLTKSEYKKNILPLCLEYTVLLFSVRNVQFTLY